MGAGDLFGEMTCMNSYPRSATVRAAEDCTVLEMLRNVLYILQRSPTFRRDPRDELPRARDQQPPPERADLRPPARRRGAVRPARRLPPRRGCSLRRCEPGEVIFRQGAPADDGFYLVRTGFVKVSQNRPGGEHVLNYVGPGGYFGEIGLLSDLPEIRALAPPGVRTATCTALDHVDLVRITADRLPRHPRPVPRPVRDAARSTRPASGSSDNRETLEDLQNELARRRSSARA